MAPKKPIVASVAGSRLGQQCQADAGSQQDVANLPDTVEGQQSLGLFLLQRLHGAGKQGDGAEQRDHTAPVPDG